MVGKRRLNKRLGVGILRATLSRGASGVAAPFRCGAGTLAAEERLNHELNPDALNHDALNHDALNHDRNPANSIGRRSDCHSKKTPPSRNIKSASQTPAAGDRRPCLAYDTPI